MLAGHVGRPAPLDAGEGLQAEVAKVGDAARGRAEVAALPLQTRHRLQLWVPEVKLLLFVNNLSHK